jgi:hypothetical protein
MRRQVGALSLLAVSTLGCVATQPVRVESVSSGSLAPVVMPVNARMLPTGADVYVALDNRIDTRSGRAGDVFSATVRHPVYAMNGDRVIPAGAKVYGRVLELDDSDYPGEEVRIRLDFNRLVFSGRSYPFDAVISQTNLEEFQQQGGISERLMLITAAIGGVLGAIFSGGEIEWALGGAAIGGAAGALYSWSRGDIEAAIPAGARMTLRTTRPILLRAPARATTTRRRTYRP